ncbi:hypothetical protein BGX38DRAFT_1183513 [Terfezia claveryi]|nr:hypothetical protein BGX38DRAFT_1183513 [Terfezia claveryi]
MAENETIESLTQDFIDRLSTFGEKNGISIEEAKDLADFVMDRDSRMRQVRAISAWAIFVKEEHRMNRVPPEMNWAKKTPEQKADYEKLAEEENADLASHRAHVQRTKYLKRIQTMSTHLQVQGVEFIGMAYNRFQLGAGATHIVGTGKGLEYVHTVLDSFGLGLDGFAAFNKGQLLNIQRKAILENMKNIPGLELFASRILGDSEPRGIEATGDEAAAGENISASHTLEIS